MVGKTLTGGVDKLPVDFQQDKNFLRDDVDLYNNTFNNDPFATNVPDTVYTKPKWDKSTYVKGRVVDVHSNSFTFSLDDVPEVEYLNETYTYNKEEANFRRTINQKANNILKRTRNREER
eukprot:UN30871